MTNLDPLAGEDPARLAVAFDRVADRLEAVRLDSENRDKALKKRDRVTRRLTWVAIGLSVAVAVAVYFAASALSEAAADRAQARNLCLSTNVARAESADMWNFVLSAAPPAQTAAQRRKFVRFEAHLRSVTAPRNCAHIDPRHP
jgi:hypothetical protein